MGVRKGPSEGGSGGRRGHSGMEHWRSTDEVKSEAKKRRRLDDQGLVDEQIREPTAQTTKRKRR